jgi:murein DD-endopeptidase MepM/ murein hydrolase activator NlpD
VSTIGIAMVNTTGIAHSESATPGGQQAGQGLTTSSVADGGTSGTALRPAVDGQTDQAVPAPRLAPEDAKMFERVEADRAQHDEVLADLAITLETRRVTSERQVRARELLATRWVSPIQGTLTQHFGGPEPHPGIDIAAPYGTSIFAAHRGTVVYAGWESGYGNFVMIQHENGVVTAYGHQAKILVSVGQKVETGQIIGLEGSTGRSTGPHLHFEVRLGGMDGTKTDPEAYLAARGIYY